MDNIKLKVGGVYNYSELRGKIIVGDEVNAVFGKNNACDKLGTCDTTNKGNLVRKITDVDELFFFIDGCSHPFAYNSFHVQIHSLVPRSDDVKPTTTNQKAKWVETHNSSFVLSDGKRTATIEVANGEFKALRVNGDKDITDLDYARFVQKATRKVCEMFPNH